MDNLKDKIEEEIDQLKQVQHIDPSIRVAIETYQQVLSWIFEEDCKQYSSDSTLNNILSNPTI